MHEFVHAYLSISYILWSYHSRPIRWLQRKWWRFLQRKPKPPKKLQAGSWVALEPCPSSYVRVYKCLMYKTSVFLSKNWSKFCVNIVCAANETFEKVASFGLHANMILYLMHEYNMELATGTCILFLWSAATNFTPIMGAFLADSHFGRFRVIALGSVVSLLVSRFSCS